jgi:hypothetical protein
VLERSLLVLRNGAERGDLLVHLHGEGIGY